MDSPTIAGVAASLSDLIVRVRGAVGPNWQDECDIAQWLVDYKGARFANVPRYLSSIDAAATLVPDGWNWMAGNRDGSLARAFVTNGEPAFVGIGTRPNPDRQWFEETARLPAMALTLVCLLAHAHLEAQTNGTR